jgi:hypothetical protein
VRRRYASFSKGCVARRQLLHCAGGKASARVSTIGGIRSFSKQASNGFYDPELYEVAAFEQLIGSLGGMGAPFFMFLADLSVSKEKIVGAEMVCRVLKRWQSSAGK